MSENRIKAVEANGVKFDRENQEYQLSFLPNSLVKYTEMTEKSREESGSDLNEPMGIFLEGSLDAKRLESSIQKVIDDEDVLRAYAFERQGEFYIKVREKYNFTLEEAQAEGTDRKDRCDNAVEMARSDASKAIPFLNPNGSVFRVKLYRIDNELSMMLITGNHAFFDNVALLLFVEAILGYYKDDSYKRIKASTYQDFMQEETDFFNSEEAKKQQAYWDVELKDYQPINFSYDRTSKVQMSSDVAKFSLKEDALNEFARNSRTSLFNVISLICHMAIAKVHNTADTLTQYAVSNRAEERYRGTIGFIARMANTHYVFDNSDIICELHKKFRKKISEGYSNGRVCQLSYGQVSHIIAFEDTTGFDIDLSFNGKPVKMLPIDITRQSLNFLCFMIMQGEDNRMQMFFEADTQFVGQGYLKNMKDACMLAEKVLLEYPDKCFGDFMRPDVSYDTVDRIFTNLDSETDIVEI